MSLFKFGKNKKTKKENQTQEEVQQEILAEEKNDMIQGVEELSATTVKEVMVPRIDVDFIPLETVEEELLQKISESGHSRIPVYEGNNPQAIFCSGKQAHRQPSARIQKATCSHCGCHR